jgi:serine/threonine protein kinase
MGACATHENVCIIMEYLELGSLYKLLHNFQYKNEFPRRVRMAKDTVQGMIYLLDKGFLHRDLKSLNLLVSKTLEVKVADFGLSKTKDIESQTSKSSTSHGPTGTYLWMAPVKDLFGFVDVDLGLGSIVEE